MTKTKKLLFALPLAFTVLFSSFLFAGCDKDDDKQAIYVTSITELNEAIQNTDDQHVIKLKNDIEMEMDGDKIIPVLVFSAEKNLDVEIDLNGYNINSYVRVASKNNEVESDKEVELNIENSKKSGGVIGFENDEFPYALVIVSNNKNSIELEDVTFKAEYGGIYTNGSYSGQTEVDADNCKFIATHTVTIENPKDGSVGAYLASKDFTYDFENCYFEGYTAYHTKHGTHILSNCTLNAIGTTAYEPAFYGNGGSATGSALMIESSYDYTPSTEEKTLKVFVKGGRLTSVANYAIQEASTADEGQDEVCYAEISITGNPILDGQGSKTVSSENNLIR